MSKLHYPAEKLDEDVDNGTMPGNVGTLADAVIGHRIVKVERGVLLPDEVETWSRDTASLALTLSNGKMVFLRDTDDCCAHTSLEDVIERLDTIDHVITNVGTTDDYTRWHIHADYGDVLELEVSWSPGNAFYYGYGFDIDVVEAPYVPPTEDEVAQAIQSIQEGY